VLLAPELLSVAKTKIDLVEVTVLELMVKSALVDPAGITMDAGTVRVVASPTRKVTVQPPAGAAVARVTVPVEVVPPTTVVGLRDRLTM